VCYLADHHKSSREAQHLADEVAPLVLVMEDDGVDTAVDAD
jgi:hypothetical protein